MSLDDVYVKTKFEQGENVFSDDDLINKFSTGQRIVVKGNGGSGKTIFLKHLWISRFKEPKGKIPVLVELRRLNELQDIDILSFCRNELQSDISFGKDVLKNYASRVSLSSFLMASMR